MFALIAAIVFAVAAVLELVDQRELSPVLLFAGLFCLALHMVWGAWPWRTPPNP